MSQWEMSYTRPKSQILANSWLDREGGARPRSNIVVFSQFLRHVRETAYKTFVEYGHRDEYHPDITYRSAIKSCKLKKLKHRFIFP